MKAVEVSAENLMVEVGNQQKIKPSTLSKDTKKAVVGLSGVGLGLDELVCHGARQVIQQAIEAELSELMEQFANVKTLQGQRAVVRNGYLPEREVLTVAGPLAVKVPKVRDRSGSGVKFNSTIVPPYVRKSPRVSAALPWLYLKGISTGDMGEALSVLLGDDAKGLSANVVSRLKAQWASGRRWKRCLRPRVASAVGSTDGQCTERAAQVATGACEGRHAIDLDGSHPRPRARCVQSFRVDLCGQISKGDRDVEEGSGEPARVLRISHRALAAFAHDQRD